MGGGDEGPTYVKRIYLLYGYPHRLLLGPFRLSLSQNDMTRIKAAYLNRRFILSSTTVTVQEFENEHSNELLRLPFDSGLIHATLESNVPILQCAAINFNKQFQNARLEKAEATIPCLEMFMILFVCIAVFNCLNNIQTISFWSDNINSTATWFIFVNVA
eukprot:425562_1